MVRDAYGECRAPSGPDGMFLITYLTDGNATHDGVQNGYRFVKASDADNAGLYNDMLYFITFRPGEAVDKTAL